MLPLHTETLNGLYYVRIHYCHVYVVDGGYTNWNGWSKCSVSCGGGTRQRDRQCTNPKPQHGGKDCSELGPIRQTEVCNTAGCPGSHILCIIWINVSISATAQLPLTQRTFTLGEGLVRSCSH